MFLRWAAAKTSSFRYYFSQGWEHHLFAKILQKYCIFLNLKQINGCTAEWGQMKPWEQARKAPITVHINRSLGGSAANLNQVCWCGRRWKAVGLWPCRRHGRELKTYRWDLRWGSYVSFCACCAGPGWIVQGRELNGWKQLEWKEEKSWVTLGLGSWGSQGDENRCKNPRAYPVVRVVGSLPWDSCSAAGSAG